MKIARCKMGLEERRPHSMRCHGLHPYLPPMYCSKATLFTMNIFEWLKSPSRKFSLATVAEEIPPYEESFGLALKFTKSLGYDVSRLQLRLSGVNVLDDNGDFIEPALRAGGITDLGRSAGQCLKWSHYLQPHFEKHLNRKVFLTIGQIWKDQTCIYGPTFEEIRRWNKNGLRLSDFENGGGFKLHAWLTVESGEIIEPTMLSSLAAAGHESFKKYAAAVVWGRDPHVLNGHRYVPVAVGSEIVENIARRSKVPLLASDVGELNIVHALIIPNRN